MTTDCTCSSYLSALKLTNKLTPSVSTARAREIGNKWAAAWSQKDSSIWTSIYANEATYTDYAFGFIRRGKRGLEEHFHLWRTANPDFQMDVLEAFPGVETNESTLEEHLFSESGGSGSLKFTIRTRNTGTFMNDLPTLKASGKKFSFYAVVDIVVRAEDGLIVKVEEWYHRQFDSPALIERDVK